MASERSQSVSGLYERYLKWMSGLPRVSQSVVFGVLTACAVFVITAVLVEDLTLSAVICASGGGVSAIAFALGPGRRPKP